MDENRYGVWVFILALIALFISTLPFTLTLLENSEVISRECSQRILLGPVALFLWGWLLGLVLAVVSLVMVRRSKDLLIKIIVWVFSSLAIIAALLWLMWVLFLVMWQLQGGFH